MLSDIPLYATIPVKDLKKSMDFYGRTLGMDIIDEDENGVWYRAGNTRFALYQSDLAGTSKTPAAIWIVHQPERLFQTLEARGLQFERHDNAPMRIAKKAKQSLSTKRRAAWFKDPSGNVICITGHR